MKYGLSVDPGVSTGVCLFSWDDDQPFRQEELWQFGNGAAGLRAFLVGTGIHLVGPLSKPAFGSIPLSAIVVEQFTPRSHAGFALTRAAVEPLRGEGVLIGRGLDPFIWWAEPAAQYFMGGNDLKERKKRSREFLKLHGIYATGKTVGQKDADDAISAELHAIAWLRRRRHQPTLVELFTPEEG